MAGVSGCFGSANPSPDTTIEDMEEVAATVEDIVEDANQDVTPEMLFAQRFVGLEKRVNTLTFALVAIALFLVIKEL